MSDRPMIFSAPMVRALLDGRKTQTRRVLKPQPELNDAGLWCWPKVTARTWRGFCQTDEDGLKGFFEGESKAAEALPARPGDHIWVREAWRVGAWDWLNAQVALDYNDGPRKEWLCTGDLEQQQRLIDQTRADARKAGMPMYGIYKEWGWLPGEGPARWRSPIHMPRWASRITLTVTDVRVQRVRDISEEDAMAEGIERLFTADECSRVTGLIGTRPEDYGWCNYLWHGRPNAKPSWVDAWRHQFSGYDDARSSFSSLWASIHGPDAWESNPWVAALTFDVSLRNIDAEATG